MVPELHPVIKSDPFMTGCDPPPYAENVIGLPDDPLEGTVSCSRHVSPLLNPTDCPAVKISPLTLEIVWNGWVIVPGLESEPVDWET